MLAPRADVTHVNWLNAQLKGRGFGLEGEIPIVRVYEQWVGDDRVLVLPLGLPLLKG